MEKVVSEKCPTASLNWNEDEWYISVQDVVESTGTGDKVVSKLNARQIVEGKPKKKLK